MKQALLGTDELQVLNDNVIQPVASKAPHHHARTGGLENSLFDLPTDPSLRKSATQVGQLQQDHRPPANGDQQPRNALQE